MSSGQPGGGGTALQRAAAQHGTHPAPGCCADG